MTVTMRGLLSRHGERHERQEFQDWLMMCLNFEDTERRVAMMETHEGGHLFGKTFLTDRRLICTRRTPGGLYFAHSSRYLSDVRSVAALGPERMIFLLGGRNQIDLVVQARGRKVSTSEFERFADRVRDGVAAAQEDRV